MAQQIQTNSDRITVRAATEQDMPAVADIYNHYVKTSTATFDTVEQTLEQRLHWFADHMTAGLPVLVAEENGAVVGWQSLSYYHSRCAYRHTVESSTYIAPSHQGRGLGRLLLEKAIAEARQRGFHSLVGLIASENEKSIELVKKCGFEIVGTLKEVGLKFDRLLDVTIVQKLLKRPAENV